MTVDPLVSVLIPVFRLDEYLQCSLESISAQTYKNIEVIVVAENDCDEIVDLAKKIGIANTRVIIGEKRGLAAALNLGIAESNGLYIARMDSDDISLPQRIEKQLEYLTRNQLDICGSSIKCFGQSTRCFNFPEFEDNVKLYSIFGSPVAHPTVFGKTHIFRKFKYDESYLSCEDYELWTRMILGGIRLGSIKIPLLRYRIHSNQLSMISESQKANEFRIRKFLSVNLSFVMLNKELSKTNYLYSDDINCKKIENIIKELSKLIKGGNNNWMPYMRIVHSIFNSSCDNGLTVACAYYRCAQSCGYPFNSIYFLWYLLKSPIVDNVITVMKKIRWK